METLLIAPSVTHDGGLATGDQRPWVPSEEARIEELTVVSPSARFTLYIHYVRIVENIREMQQTFGCNVGPRRRLFP